MPPVAWEESLAKRVGVPVLTVMPCGTFGDLLLRHSVAQWRCFFLGFLFFFQICKGAFDFLFLSSAVERKSSDAWRFSKDHHFRWELTFRHSLESSFESQCAFGSSSRRSWDSRVTRSHSGLESLSVSKHWHLKISTWLTIWTTTPCIGLIKATIQARISCCFLAMRYGNNLFSLASMTVRNCHRHQRSEMVAHQAAC